MYIFHLFVHFLVSFSGKYVINTLITFLFHILYSAICCLCHTNDSSELFSQIKKDGCILLFISSLRVNKYFSINLAYQRAKGIDITLKNGTDSKRSLHMKAIRRAIVSEKIIILKIISTDAYTVQSKFCPLV